MSEREFFVYWVQFFEPPIEGDWHRDFFFSSVSAIYTIFSREDIGAGEHAIWSAGLRGGKVYQNRRCIIRREPLISKPRGYEAQKRTRQARQEQTVADMLERVNAGEAPENIHPELK